MSKDEDEKQIQKTLKPHELILQCIGEGVYGIDKNGNTTFANPAAEAMTGWKEEELLGKIVHNFHHHTKNDGSPYPSHECPVYRTIQDGIGRHVDSENFWRKDGTSFPVEYISTPIIHEGKIEGAVIVFKDISERKKAEEQISQALEEVRQLKDQLQEENSYLINEIQQQYNYAKLIGDSAPMQHILSKIENVAPTSATVLIQGESGTGKELIARAIHANSARRDRPLVKVNCGAINPSLIESELFGHEKGAFTGAIQKRIGRFELAHKGTLFLDEVGELSLDMQVKLLRVLQEGEFERVGSSKSIKVDVRIVSATHRNIEEMVSDGSFRSDLYYRLSVFPIHAPSLRQRKEDIPQLSQHILASLNDRLRKKYDRIDDISMQRLLSYHWPGNVRELQNVLERAAITGKPPTLSVNIFGADAAQLPPSADRAQVAQVTNAQTLEEVERNHIIDILNKVNWQIGGKMGAARLLDLPDSTLRSKMKKLGINRPA